MRLLCISPLWSDVKGGGRKQQPHNTRAPWVHHGRAPAVEFLQEQIDSVSVKLHLAEFRLLEQLVVMVEGGLVEREGRSVEWYFHSL